MELGHKFGDDEIEKKAKEICLIVLVIFDWV